METMESFWIVAGEQEQKGGRPSGFDYYDYD
jgi:hypothetical protein